MPGIAPASSPGRRDAALRRLRLANRVLLGTMIALTVVLAELASRAFAGHARHVAPAVSVKPRHPVPSRAAARRRHRSAERHHHRLNPPAASPTTADPQSTTADPQSTTADPQSTTADSQSTTASTPPAPAPAPAPSPQPAPAPVSSGGS